MKRNSKILAFIIALAMVMTMVVLPVSAATDVMTDADYVAPTGVNLLDEWGLNYNYDITTTTTTGLYGWNNTTVDANVSGGTRLAGRDPSITKNAGTMTTKSGIGVDGTSGGYANLGATGKQARINYVPFDNEPGTVYKMTVDVKIANETIEEGGTPITSDTLSWSAEGTTNSKNKVVAVSSSGLTVNNTDYTTVTYIFKTAVNKTTGYDRNHAHIGVKTTNATELYLDNWTLEKIGTLLYEKNCGFENGDVTGLSTNLEENVAYWVTSDAARSGSYGFKMTATNNQTDIRYTGLKLTDGAYYRASVWAKLASDNTVENVTSSLIFTRGTVLVSKNPTLRADGWEEITAEFKVNLNGSTNGVNFGPKITSGASVYLDDFSLEQFTPAAFTATLTEGTITTDSAEINVSFSSAP
ncbi:MAG: hypothetical protein IJ300_02645, partial [Clostridia bacterium]|nr:hypothetical protein [Clostridia bacterium]